MDARPSTLDAPAGEGVTPTGSQITCPRCGYDLRLLPQPRCPECGAEFVWQELVGAARLKHTTPLFEYRWRDRPLRSLIETLARAMVPPLLWHVVPPTLEPRVGPLFVLVGVAAIGIAALDVPLTYAYGYYYNRTLVVSPLPELAVGLCLRIVSGLLVWLNLLLFFSGGARAHLGWKHALRAVTLASVASLLWSWLLDTAMISSAIACHYWIGRNLCVVFPRTHDWGLRMAELWPLAVALWSMSLGLRRQLGVARGICAAVLSMVLAALLLTTGVVAISVFVYDSFDHWLTMGLANRWPLCFELLGGAVRWVLVR